MRNQSINLFPELSNENRQQLWVVISLIVVLSLLGNHVDAKGNIDFGAFLALKPVAAPVFKPPQSLRDHAKNLNQNAPYEVKLARQIRETRKLRELGTPNPFCHICGLQNWMFLKRYHRKSFTKVQWGFLEKHHLAGLHRGPWVILCLHCHKLLSYMQYEWPKILFDELRNSKVERASLYLGNGEFLMGFGLEQEKEDPLVANITFTVGLFLKKRSELIQNGTIALPNLPPTVT